MGNRRDADVTRVKCLDQRLVQLGLGRHLQDYEADRTKLMGAAAEQPHRLRYKPLTRG